MSQSPILAYINRFVPLNQEEAVTIEPYFKEANIKKKQYIVQPDFTVSYRYYVIKGAFHSYVLDERGEQHTIAFAVDDWWITDYNSYIYQQAATMFVIALEDSLVLKLNYADEVKLKAMFLSMETFFRIIAERGLAYQQRRLISNLTENAEERYLHFMEKYANIAQRIPQYVLASFLGMTTEYLSKLRKRQLAKRF